MVKLILIRHAESEENVKVKSFCKCVENIFQFQAPKLKDVWRSVKLAECNLDSKISLQGNRQISDVSIQMKQAKFWENEFTACVYSPLQRAVKTFEGIVPIEYHEKKCIKLECLREATPFEHVFRRSLYKRIETFHQWIQNSGFETIIVVGHSQYFKRMLNLKNLMRNCDVWETTIAYARENNASSYVFSEPLLLFRSNIANDHPLNNLLKIIFSKKNNNNNDSEHTSINDDLDNKDDEDKDINNNNNTEDQAMCRICQVFIYLFIIIIILLLLFFFSFFWVTFFKVLHN
jgi:phosphohistidine phosphatase SixA